MRDWLAAGSAAPRLLLTPRATQTLADWARATPPQPVTVMVGPEGGFTDEEEQEALRQGAIGVAMGPRILRTETAGLAVLAALGMAWGA